MRVTLSFFISNDASPMRHNNSRVTLIQAFPRCRGEVVGLSKAFLIQFPGARTKEVNVMRSHTHAKSKDKKMAEKVDVCIPHGLRATFVMGASLSAGVPRRKPYLLNHTCRSL